MNTTKMQQRGTPTLPKKIRESLNLKEGEILSVVHDENRIILERHESVETELLRDIKKSLADIKNGKFIEFGSLEEFKNKLNAYDAD